MPWREIVFTKAGPVYPPSWDMATSDMKKTKRDASSPLDKHNFQFPSFADFADDGDSTSEANIWVGNVCSGDDLDAPIVLETKAETVG